MGPRDMENLAAQTGTPSITSIAAALTTLGPILGVANAQRRTVTAQANLAQTAATRTLLTAGGDVYCEVKQAYVYTAATGLTSVHFDTGHTTPKSIVGSTVLASLTLDAILTLVTSAFVLPTGKTITSTIVGTGTAGLVYLVIDYIPLTAGATLS